MKFSQTKVKLIVLAAVLLLTPGLRCKFITPSQKQLLEPVTLNWWGTFEPAANFADIIAAYGAIHPNIKINYRQFRPEQFGAEIVNALAEDRGPDIFSIRSTEVAAYRSKIAPLPAKTTVAYEIKQRALGVKEETIIEIRDEPSLTPNQIREQFLDPVLEDIVSGNQIWALPLSVNTMVMFFNRDLLNNAGIPLPATTWQELQDHVRRLTFQDGQGKLIQSGVAIGTAGNVSYSPDILSLLMMQSGAVMTDNRRATFGFVPAGSADPTYNPGPTALQFYADFATPGREVYTWSYDFPGSIDAFSQGQVAYAFGYTWDKATIDARRQGKLNYSVAPMLQIQDRPRVNFARYFVHTVSKKSAHANEAWNFIQFASRPENVRAYLQRTGQPTALRVLVQEQLADEKLKIFADQLLTAKSWYHSWGIWAVEAAFMEMIDAVAVHGTQLRQAIDLATQRVNQTL